MQNHSGDDSIVPVYLTTLSSRPGILVPSSTSQRQPGIKQVINKRKLLPIAASTPRKGRNHCSVLSALCRWSTESSLHGFNSQLRHCEVWWDFSSLFFNFLLSLHLHRLVNDACITFVCTKVAAHVHLSSHLSLNRQGRWGTTDDFATLCAC